MLSEWDEKIRDAISLLRKVEDRGIRLREAIKTFEAERDAVVQLNNHTTEAATRR
jgi:hypothetical protein